MTRAFAPAILAVLSLAVVSLPVSARAQSHDENTQHCEQDDNPDLAITSCTALIQFGQDSGVNLAADLNNRGAAYEKKKQYDLALADLNQAIGLNPTLAAAFSNRGNVYADKRQYNAAIADQDYAIRLKPDFAGAFNNRGIVYDDEVQYDTAIVDFDHAIQLDPTYADAFMNRAVVHGKKKEYDLSIADATQAIRLKPDDADAFVDRGHAHSLKSEYNLAIADLNQAIRLNPSEAVAFNDRGHAYEDTEQYKLAIADYAEDLRLRPDHADGWNNRCWARAIVGELVQALGDCNQSLTLRPNDANSLDSRGFTYLKLGRFDLAILDYNAALALNPKQAESLYGRGLAERKGNPVSAKSDITAALTIKPQVIAEFRRWGVDLPLPAGVPPILTLPGALSAETLKALDDVPAYRTLSGLYDMNKDIAIWQQSEQGQAVIAVLQLIRSDAEAIGSAPGDHGPVLQYSIGGITTSDSGIAIADFVASPGYLHTIADAVAGQICFSKQVQAFFESLGRAGAGTK
jgi:tetratricopeptide (TPR) repeat protein